MVPHRERLWTQSGQLPGPQGVDGKKSPNLWRVAVTRPVIEQRVSGGRRLAGRLEGGSGVDRGLVGGRSGANPAPWSLRIGAGRPRIRPRADLDRLRAAPGRLRAASIRHRIGPGRPAIRSGPGPGGMDRRGSTRNLHGNCRASVPGPTPDRGGPGPGAGQAWAGICRRRLACPPRVPPRTSVRPSPCERSVPRVPPCPALGAAPRGARVRSGKAEGAPGEIQGRPRRRPRAVFRGVVSRS